MVNRDLYDKFDKPGKILLNNILEKRGFKLVGDINHEYYAKTDLIFINPKTNKQEMWEIEVKNSVYFERIINNEYKTVIVNTRKAINQSQWFCLFSSNWDKLLITNFSNIKKSPIKSMIFNFNQNETFFIVDSKLWHLFLKEKYYNIKEIIH